MKRLLKTAKSLSINLALALVFVLIAASPLGYGVNCENAGESEQTCPCCQAKFCSASAERCPTCKAKTISIGGGGSVGCGEQKNYSVNTGDNTYDSYAWEIINNGGTILQPAGISSPSSQNTDVTVYWFDDNESPSCTWTLKCTAKLGTCDFSATATLSISLPDEGGRVDTSCQPDWTYAEGYGKFWITSASVSPVQPEGGIQVNIPSSCIFYTKVYTHEGEHLTDANDTSYTSQFVSDSKYWLKLVDAGLTTPQNSPCTSYLDLYIRAELKCLALMNDLVIDMDDRAYPVSNPIWPQLFYQSDSGRSI